MSKVTVFSLVVAFGVALAPMAFAQSSTNEFGQTTYPANLAGVDMASIPATDLCQLDGNAGLTAEALALVDAEILARGLICDAILAPGGLGATNLAGLAPAFATVLIAALAAGGDGPSGTSDTQ